MVGHLSTNSDFSVGTYIWVKAISNGPNNIPRACRILSAKSKQLKVIDDVGQEFWISVGSVLKKLHPSSLVPIEDMIALGELEDYTILRNLHLRYIQNMIYTYVGMVLVAINPYQQLPLYNEKQMKMYIGSKLTELPPHIYAIGNTCYQELIRKRKSQCVVISGETGAGKTESTKLLLDYLATLSGRKTPIENQIIQANPILEAFGNAKTVYNDNSSRFGKLIELYFNELGTLEGASIQQYLLEKSRVTLLKPGDQNYHIFYSLISGLSWEEKCQLDLKSCLQFDYLNKVGPKISLEQREAMDLGRIRDAMKILNFTDEEIWDTFKISAAILHLGNMIYLSNMRDYIEGTEIKDGPSMDIICKLLGVNKNSFKDTFSKKTIFIQGHKTVTEVTKVQAMMTRNGFAKTLFDKLFCYIVDKINKTILNKSSPKYSIRILDVYGFENFKNNSFEQLCINYTNEHLQQVFVHHIFKIEQEEYAKEGIKWEHLSFMDNEAILHLIGLHPNSLMVIIDEQSQLITGSDEALITKANKIHGKNKYYVKQKSDISLYFGILHYAGEVTYSVEGFLDKNRNPLTNNCLQLIKTSSNLFMKNLFAKELQNNQPHQGKVQTVSLQYQNSLEVLIRLINSSQPYFIRCIKPNLNKRPNAFDLELCCCQLRYSGMMETAKIRRSGYPVRYSYSDFVHRYRILLESSKIKKEKEHKKLSSELCKNVLGKDDYQFGKTKVFLKIKHDISLEKARDKILEKKILIIQKNCKMLYAKKRYSKMRKAATVIQKYWRGYKDKKNYRLLEKGILRLQANIRSRKMAFSYLKFRICIVRLQARCRGFIKRKEISQKQKFPKLENKNDELVSDMDAWITSVFKSALDEETETSIL